jgi:hypothetical protein
MAAPAPQSAAEQRDALSDELWCLIHADLDNARVVAVDEGPYDFARYRRLCSAARDLAEAIDALDRVAARAQAGT